MNTHHHCYTGCVETEAGWSAGCGCGHRTKHAANRSTAYDRILAHLAAARKREAAKLAKQRAKVGKKNLAKARAAKAVAR